MSFSTAAPPAASLYGTGTEIEALYSIYIPTN